MTNEESKRWLKATIELSKDVNAQVSCPHCAQADLSVEDIFYKNLIRERRLYCKECGAQNYVLFGTDCSQTK